MSEKIVQLNEEVGTSAMSSDSAYRPIPMGRSVGWDAVMMDGLPRLRAMGEGEEERR